MENLTFEKKEKISFSVMSSFWLLALIAVLSKNGYLFGMYTISVLIHEFAHFFIAKKLHYNCRSIKLSAFGAMLYGEFDDVDRVDSIKIAIAGPLMNFLLAIATIALWWVFPISYNFTVDFMMSNVSLGLINLLPCYPLDGGRIFVAFLEKKVGFFRSLKISRFLSLSLGCGFFLIFLIGVLYKQNFYSCGLFGFFLTLTGAGETKRAIYRKKAYMDVSKLLLKKGIEKKFLVFDGNSKLSDVVKKIKDNCFYQLTIFIDDNNFFVLEQPQINYCLMSFTLDTPLKSLIKYKV